MSRNLVLCACCRCHVVAGDRRCPHCDADLSGPRGTFAPTPRVLQVRRVLVASALAAMGTACASSSSTGQTNQDVQGTCVADSGAAVPRCDDTMGSGCSCGSGGRCDAKTGKCVSCQCPTNESCTSDGTCSTHTCYGSPPLLA